MVRAKNTTKATKATKSDDKKATAVPTNVVKEPVVVPEPTVVTQAPTLVETPETPVIPTVIDQFGGFMTKLQGVSSQMSALRAEFRSLERQVARELKAAAKITQKRKRKTGNRAPSGFVKPTLISNELATFLSKPVGSEMARTEVTREINAYIRQHKLQDKDNGRKIIADKKLTDLLKLKKGDELTYFNLQKYMSPHFAKASDKATATVAV